MIQPASVQLFTTRTFRLSLAAVFGSGFVVSLSVASLLAMPSKRILCSSLNLFISAPLLASCPFTFPISFSNWSLLSVNWGSTVSTLLSHSTPPINRKHFLDPSIVFSVSITVLRKVENRKCYLWKHESEVMSGLTCVPLGPFRIVRRCLPDSAAHCEASGIGRTAPHLTFDRRASLTWWIRGGN